jgi:hypothetical protein
MILSHTIHLQVGCDNEHSHSRGESRSSTYILLVIIIKGLGNSKETGIPWPTMSLNFCRFCEDNSPASFQIVVFWDRHL